MFDFSVHFHKCFVHSHCHFAFFNSLFNTKNNDEQPLHCEALLEFDNDVNINEDEEEGDNNSLGESINEGDSSDEGGSSDKDSDEECNRGSDDISVGESSIGSCRLLGDDWGVIKLHYSYCSFDSLWLLL